MFLQLYIRILYVRTYVYYLHYDTYVNNAIMQTWRVCAETVTIT